VSIILLFASLSRIDNVWIHRNVNLILTSRREILIPKNFTADDKIARATDSERRNTRYLCIKLFALAYMRKKIAALCFFQVIAFLEKKPSRHLPIRLFSIFTCALAASCAQIALSIPILLLFLCQTYMLATRKNWTPCGWREFFRIWYVVICSQNWEIELKICVLDLYKWNNASFTLLFTSLLSLLSLRSILK